MVDSLVAEVFPADFAGRIVVPGCGRAWDVGGLAAALPGAEIIGIDLSDHALDGVSQSIRDHSRVRLLRGDFLDQDWLAREIGTVAAVWEHTCFCAIHPSRRPDYLASVSTILEPGALLLGLFFLNMEQTSDGPPWNCPPEELASRFGPAFVIEQCTPANITFEGRHGEEFAVVMRKRP